MIEVGLNRVRSLTPLAFERMICAERSTSPTPTEIRKALLRRVYMSVLLVVADCIQGFRAEDANYGAKDIRLF